MTVSDFASSASWGYSQTADLPAGEFSAAFNAGASQASGTMIAAEDPSICELQLDLLQRQMNHIASEMAAARTAQRNGDEDAMRGHLQNVKELAEGALHTCFAFGQMCKGAAGGLTAAQIQQAELMCQQIQLLGQRADRMLFELDQKGARGVDLEPAMTLVTDLLKGLGALLGGGALWLLEQIFRRPGTV